MRKKTSIYKLFTISVLACSLLITSACSKDDSSSSTAPTSNTGSNNTGGSGTTPKTNKEIITTNTWKLTKLMLNNVDANFGSYKACEIDNDWLFRNQSFEIISRGTTCTANEANGSVYKTGPWAMAGGNSYSMQLDNEQYTIISINSTQLRIRVQRNNENWDYIFSAK